MQMNSSCVKGDRDVIGQGRVIHGKKIKCFYKTTKQRDGHESVSWRGKNIYATFFKPVAQIISYRNKTKKESRT